MALNVTIQAQILHPIMALRDETGMGTILISQDLRVAADHRFGGGDVGRAGGGSGVGRAVSIPMG